MLLLDLHIYFTEIYLIPWVLKKGPRNYFVQKVTIYSDDIRNNIYTCLKHVEIGIPMYRAYL